jgi:hypothetical protein
MPTKRINKIERLKKLRNGAIPPLSPYAFIALYLIKQRAKCIYINSKTDHGSVLFEALCYKPEGRGFETRQNNLMLSICLIIPATLGPGVCSASNRNEYQMQKDNVSGK